MMEDNKLDQLKASIKTQLDLCDPFETPTVCSMKSKPTGYAKIEDMVIRKVLYTNNPSIADAIVDIENEFDINSLD